MIVIPSPPILLDDQQCVICGFEAATFHYGAVTCSSCKVFFLRTTLSKRVHLCERENNCQFPHDRCRACRFQKCLKMGMNPKIVGRRKNMQKQIKEEELPDLCVVPYFTQDCMAQLQSALKDPIKQESAMDVAKFLLRIESFCNGDIDTALPSCSTASPSIFFQPTFAYTLNVELNDAIRNPALVCDRTPVGFSSPLRLSTDKPTEVFLQLYCRMTTHFLDWATAKSETWEFDEKNRTRLLRRQASACLVLTFCYYSYLFNSDGILLGHGFQHRRQKEEVAHEMQDFSTRVVDYAHSHIVSVFKAVSLTPEEYALIKTILLFTPIGALSDEAIAIASRSRRRYESMLLELSNEQWPLLPPAAKTARLTQIVSILPHLLKLGNLNDSFLSRMVTLNMDNMRGQLSKDFHLTE